MKLTFTDPGHTPETVEQNPRATPRPSSGRQRCLIFHPLEADTIVITEAADICKRSALGWEMNTVTSYGVPMKACSIAEASY